MSIFYQTTFVSACGVLIFGMFYHAITTGASLPDVHVSYSTQKCIKVVNYVEGHKYTCNDLPSHYYHVWVK
jgi:hypothetical protein